MSTKMTRKELSFLTQKQLKEYAQMQGATKIPKKWQDKETALNWLEKNLGTKAETPKKEVKKTVKKEGTGKPSGSAVARREKFVVLLRKEPCSAVELSEAGGNAYKSVLDDMHAIRHSRAEVFYLEENEVLIGVNLGKSKAFRICKASEAEKVTTQMKEEIKLT